MLNSLKLSFVELFLVHLLILRAALLGKKCKVAIYQVEQQVRDRYEVIPSTVRHQIKAMFACEYQITLKEPLFRSFNVPSLLIYVLNGETEINYFYFVQVVFVVRQIGRIANQNVVQFNVIECVASIVYQFNLV